MRAVTVQARAVRAGAVRIKTRWRAGVVGLAALSLALSACSQPTTGGGGPGGGGPGGSGPGGGTGSGGSGAGRSQPAGRASGPVAAAPQFCQAPQATAAAAPGKMVPRSSRSEFVPLGVSATGQMAYVSAWTRGFAGVAELVLKSGRLLPIRRFPDPAADQADGASAGRWLVWAQTYSLTSLDRFTMLAFDAATGRLRQIGHSLAAPGGAPWPSPWHAPAVSGNYAAWAQGAGPRGLVEIRLADLMTGAVRTIARGHVQPPFFDGGLVIWPQADHAAGQTSLRAYSVTRRAAATLPPVLAGVRGTDMVVTDGTRTAYLSPDFTRLYFSPGQNVAARLALRLPAGVDFTSLALAPATMAWTTSEATYLSSTRTGAFVQVTPQYGYATGSSSVMLITDPPVANAAHPPLPTYVVNPAALRWPACAGG
jgi:hypothetical protein